MHVSCYSLVSWAARKRPKTLQHSAFPGAGAVQTHDNRCNNNNNNNKNKNKNTPEVPLRGKPRIPTNCGEAGLAGSHIYAACGLDSATTTSAVPTP